MPGLWCVAGWEKGGCEMILHLPDGRYVSVESHSGKIWVTSYNGCGNVNPLTPEQAQEFGLAIWRAGRKMGRSKR
jgi:hypothetical protein